MFVLQAYRVSVTRLPYIHSLPHVFNGLQVWRQEKYPTPTNFEINGVGYFVNLVVSTCILATTTTRAINTGDNGSTFKH